MGQKICDAKKVEQKIRDAKKKLAKKSAVRKKMAQKIRGAKRNVKKNSRYLQSQFQKIPGEKNVKKIRGFCKYQKKQFFAVTKKIF